MKSKRNKSVEKRNLKLKINKSNYVLKTNDYIDTEVNEKLRAKIQSDKEKKEYEEKLRIMKNHISAMRRQQEDMDKKLVLLRNKENNINNVKKEKESYKQTLLAYNIKKRDELEKKRKNIEKQKEMLNKGMKESTEKAKNDKINNYKQLQKEKEKVYSKVYANNQKKQNRIKDQKEKIKTTRENNKNYALNRKKMFNQSNIDLNEKEYETNVEKTKLLKMQMDELKTEENELLAKLNVTKERLNIYCSTEVLNHGKNKKRSSKNSGVRSTKSFENKNTE
jgi:hypothetical protein